MDEFEHEYDSPFGEPVCNYPRVRGLYRRGYDPDVFPSLHSYSDRCPAHPYPDWDSSPWLKWYKAREEYANTGRSADLEKMCGYVTETVPPMAPARKPAVSAKVKRKRPDDFFLLVVAMGAIAFVLSFLAILI